MFDLSYDNLHTILESGDYLGNYISSDKNWQFKEMVGEEKYPRIRWDSIYYVYLYPT